MEQTKPRKNNLGASGWVWAGKYKLERYLYILHRITGLGLILFTFIHLCLTTIFRMQGQDVWDSVMVLFHNPWFMMGEFLVVVGFAFHAVNGIRLIIQQWGFGLGKPTPPIYPYKDSLRKKRSGTIIMIVIIVILALIFLYDFVAGGW